MTKRRRLPNVHEQTSFIMSRALWSGLIAVVLHSVLCALIVSGIYAPIGSWGWFVVFIVDFPVSVLFLPVTDYVPTALVFLALWGAWWFTVAYMLTKWLMALKRTS